MEVALLKEDVRLALKSGMQINSVKDCVLELVYNSLDAKSTAIAVRINLMQMFIQVVDDGCGISHESLLKIGLPNMTSKCSSLKDLRKPREFIGYRGDALSSIRTLSEKVVVSTRQPDSEETYNLTLEHNTSVINLIKHRPSPGTTVTIHNFMYNLPVRQNRVNVEVDLEEIRQNLEALAIINPEVAISLRNNINKKMLIEKESTESTSNALITFYKDISVDDLWNCKVSKDKTKIEAVLCKKTVDIKTLQYIFVNKRVVYCKEIKRTIVKLLAKSYYFDKNGLKNKKVFPVFVINIVCSPTKLSFDTNNSQTTVEFTNFHIITECLSKTLQKFIQYIAECLEKDSNYSLTSAMMKSHPVAKRKSSEKVALNNKKPCLEIERQNEECKVKKSIRSYFCEAVESQGGHNKKKQKKTTMINLKQKPKHSYRRRDEDIMTNFMKNYKYNSKEHQVNNKLLESPLNRLLNANILLDNEKTENLDMAYNRTEDYNLCNNFDKPVHITDKIGTYKEADNACSNTQKPEVVKIINNYLIKSCNAEKQICNNENPVTGTHMIASSNDEVIPETNTIEKNPSKASLIENISSGIRNNCNIVSPNTNDKTVTSMGRVLERFNSGKDFIMDMFLKSSHLYPNDDVKETSQKQMLDVTKHTLQKTIGQYKNTSGTGTPNNESQIQYYETNNEQSTSNYKSKITFLNMKKSTKNSVYTMNQTILEVKKPRKTSPASKHKIANKVFEMKTNAEDEFELDFSKEFQKEDRVQGISNTIKIKNFYCKNIFLSSGRENHQEKCNDKALTKKTQSHKHRKQSCEENNYGLKLKNKRNKNKNRNNTKPVYKGRNIRHDSKPINKNNSKFDVYSTRSSTNTNNNNSELFYDVSQSFEESRNEYINNNSSSFKSLIEENGYKFLENTCENMREDNALHIQNFKENRYENMQQNYTVPIHNFKENRFENKQHALSIQNEDIYRCENTHQNSVSNENVEDKNVLESHTLFDKSGIEIDTENYFAVNDISLCSASSFAKMESQYAISKSLFDDNAQLNEENEEIFFKIPQEPFRSMSHQNLVDKTTLTANEHDKLFPSNPWVPTFDNFGKMYYVNPHKGITTYVTPKKNENFAMKKRNDIIPKGYSPAIIENVDIQLSLSPQTKEKLHRHVFSRLSKELGFVKWEKYFNETDHNSFFDELYTWKSNQFENLIPQIKDTLFENIPTNRKEVGITETFDKDFLKDVEIIGQLDNKFIVANVITKNLLVIFDQHAVHERIRLEKLLKDYSMSSDDVSLKSSTLKEKLAVKINEHDLDIVKNNLQNFNAIGLTLEVKETYVIVLSIPTCYYNKWTKCDDKTEINDWIKLLIYEELDMIKNIRGYTAQMPQTIKDIINMEACRGAIKFGDALSKDDCKSYINSLRNCNLPFQCAHGRPTIKPLIIIEKTIFKQKTKLNFSRIKSK